MLVLVVGLAYMLWRHRAEIAPGADGIPEDAAAPPTPQDRTTPSPEENPS